MSMRLLISEDSATNRLLLSMTLERLGYKAEIVANGAEAVEKFSPHLYDLVFLDLNMPVMDGIETAWEISKHNSRHIPVYAISGFPPAQMEKKFSKVGIRRCLIKPLDREKLAEVIKECGLAKALPQNSTLPDNIPKRLMATYAHELRSRAQACARYCEDKDKKALIREAHTLRALAQMLNIEQLDARALTLEEECQTDEEDFIAAQVRQIIQICDDTASRLERLPLL